MYLVKEKHDNNVSMAHACLFFSNVNRIKTQIIDIMNLGSQKAHANICSEMLRRCCAFFDFWRF